MIFAILVWLFFGDGKHSPRMERIVVIISLMLMDLAQLVCLYALLH